MRQKILKSAAFFFVFCIFLNENKTKSHDFNTFRKLKEWATIVASWEKSPKKESAYPKREMDTHRLQKLNIDYTVYIKDYKSQTYTTKFTVRLQKSDYLSRPSIRKVYSVHFLHYKSL